MTTRDPGEMFSPEPNILERRAADYLARLSGPGDGSRPGGPERLDAAALARTTRWTVALAAAAGVVSGGLMGGMEIWIREVPLGGGEGTDWQDELPWWIGFFAVAGVISAVEIAFLYYLTLSGIARITGPSGLALGTEGYAALYARSLARGALEFPNPQVTFFGIDPYAYVPGWRLTAKNIAYKMKVGVSSFLMRVFLRRVAARMAIRGMVPLFAGPLYAVWNAVIVWRILTEGKVRSLGPFAIERSLGEMFGDGARPGQQAGEVMLEGVAEMIMRAGDAHPNHLKLICRLREELGVEADLEPDWQGQADAADRLEDVDRARLLDLLALTAITGSAIRRDQRRFLAAVAQRLGSTTRTGALKTARKALLAGRPVGRRDLAAVRGG